MHRGEEVCPAFEGSLRSRWEKAMSTVTTQTETESVRSPSQPDGCLCSRGGFFHPPPSREGRHRGSRQARMGQRLSYGAVVVTGGEQPS